MPLNSWLWIHVWFRVISWIHVWIQCWCGPRACLCVCARARRITVGRFRRQFPLQTATPSSNAAPHGAVAPQPVLPPPPPPSAALRAFAPRSGKQPARRRADRADRTAHAHRARSGARLIQCLNQVTAGTAHSRPILGRPAAAMLQCKASKANGGCLAGSCEPATDGCRRVCHAGGRRAAGVARIDRRRRAVTPRGRTRTPPPFGDGSCGPAALMQPESGFNLTGSRHGSEVRPLGVVAWSSLWRRGWLPGEWRHSRTSLQGRCPDLTVAIVGRRRALALACRAIMLLFKTHHVEKERESTGFPAAVWRGGLWVPRCLDFLKVVLPVHLTKPWTWQSLIHSFAQFFKGANIRNIPLPRVTLFLPRHLQGRRSFHPGSRAVRWQTCRQIGRNAATAGHRQRSASWPATCPGRPGWTQRASHFLGARQSRGGGEQHFAGSRSDSPNPPWRLLLCEDKTHPQRRRPWNSPSSLNLASSVLRDRQRHQTQRREQRFRGSYVQIREFVLNSAGHLKSPEHQESPEILSPSNNFPLPLQPVVKRIWQ